MKYTRNVAINVVIANMIGTGVFFSLGFQAGDIPSWFSIMILWIIGAIISLLGALCYSEISTRIAGSGGEYNYLSKIYSDGLGFTAGWVSFIVGVFLWLPWLAVEIRRLHDIGRSGWWFLISFTVIGIILLIIWAIMEGDDRPNEYGEVPTNTIKKNGIPTTDYDNY